MEIISVAELKIGMFVSEPDCPWSEFTFALQGFVVSTPDQVETFRRKCRFVSIDRSRSLDEHYAAVKHGRDRPLKAAPLGGVVSEEPAPARRRFAPPPNAEPRQLRRLRFLNFLHAQQDSEPARELAGEIVQIEPRYELLTNSLFDAFEVLAKGKDVDLVSIRAGLRDIAGSLQRNPDAVLWLLRLKRRDEYSFDHAMDVAVTMLMLGSHIGWRGPQLIDLGMIGMFQDVGKVELPVDLLTKKSELSEEERQLVRSHVASSMEILLSQTTVANDVVLAVARHHERWDGSGYPQGLKFEQIGKPAEIAGLADSFCAMLRDKPYRNALGHQEALEELHGLRGKQFNGALIEQFVQCVGLYPIGTVVELDTGEVGVVIQQNRVQRSRPRVVVMLDADKQRVRNYRVIDLRLDAHAKLRVAKALPHNAYGLAANDYYLG